MQGKQNKN